MGGMTRFIVLLTAVCAALVMLWLARDLPPVVASHFNAAGQADGFTGRTVFVALMLLLGAGLPAGIWWWGLRQARAGSSALNLPNASYWLAPERRAQTVAALDGWLALLAVLLSAFLVAMFALVVAANRSVPPAPLNNTGFWSLLVAFNVAVLGLVVWWWRRFRLPR